MLRFETPTEVRRRVPLEIARDTGLVLVDPQLGHLNLSTMLCSTV
jgi:hypothetical protein